MARRTLGGPVMDVAEKLEFAPVRDGFRALRHRNHHQRQVLAASQRSWSDVVTLSLTDCAHRFCKGRKMRLLVAGGSHPRCIRNLGTDEDPVRGARMQVVKHAVRYETSAVSKLALSVTKAQ